MTDKDIERLKEEIKYETEVLKLARHVGVPCDRRRFYFAASGKHFSLENRLGGSRHARYNRGNHDGLASRSENSGARGLYEGECMTSMEWLAAGMGITVMVAFLILFWKMTTHS